MLVRLVIVLLLALLAAATPATAAEPFPGTEWSEHYFPSGDGTMLHADVLRPAGLPADAKTPVLLTVSPYTNHSGDTSWGGGNGPSDRFYDFLELGRIPQRGYTYVMVDLRGFGGSAGCNDWGGPGERMDSKAAVEWAASQPWSTGRVGLVGKSYDGWTGLMAIAEQPKGLAAVLSMEPVYSGYRYLYMDGVRFSNSLATPTSFTAIDAQPGGTEDTAEYHLNGTGVNVGCYAANIGQQQIDDPTADFWVARDLLPELKGATTPLFLTQGFLERNTKPDGAFAAFNGMAGPKRAWFGQFDHVRGWELQNEELATGRAGFIDEAMRFLDHHLKGEAAPADPPVVVQGFDGRYRAEAAWPPADAIMYEGALREGIYSDDGSNSGEGDGAGQGLWTVSPPLPHAAHLAGEPQVEVEVADAVPRANLVVNVYDIAPDGRATMISRGARLLRDGAETASLEMYGQDWPIAAGHRIGVLVSGANSDWWTHSPTNAPVSVSGGRVRLPFLRYERVAYLDGGAGPRLRSHLEQAPFQVAPELIADAESRFELPPPMVVAPPATGSPSAVPPTSRPRRLLTVRARRRGKVLRIAGRAPARSRLRIAVMRGKRTLARRAVKVGTSRRYAVRLRVRGSGRLTVRVTARTRGGRRLRALARAARA